MKRIFKYELKVTYEQSIAMYITAKILTVQVQHGKPCVWAEVSDQLPKVAHRAPYIDEVTGLPAPPELVTFRTFYTFATGQPLPEEFDQLHYVGTYQLHDGSFVGHVYVDRIQ